MNTTRSHFLVLVSAISMVTCGATTPAYAYLDPGTGTMILQGIIAAIGGALAFGYYYFNRLKQLLKSLRGGSRAVDESEILQHRNDENDQTRR